MRAQASTALLLAASLLATPAPASAQDKAQAAFERLVDGNMKLIRIVGVLEHCELGGLSGQAVQLLGKKAQRQLADDADAGLLREGDRHLVAKRFLEASVYFALGFADGMKMTHAPDWKYPECVNAPLVLDELLRADADG